MSDRTDLHLHEQLMLLALRDEKGTLESKALMYGYALGGAILAELSLRGRTRAATWVARFAQMKRLRHRVAEDLCRRGILRDSEDKVLLFFTRKSYPTIDPGPERRFVDQLRTVVFSDSAFRDPETAVVAALANATGLLAIHFDKKDLKRRKQHLKRIAEGSVAGTAVEQAVRAAEQAVIAAVVTASVATTVSVSSAG